MSYQDPFTQAFIDQHGMTPQEAHQKMKELEAVVVLFMLEFKDQKVLEKTPIAYYKVARAANKALGIQEEDD